MNVTVGLENIPAGTPESPLSKFYIGNVLIPGAVMGPSGFKEAITATTPAVSGQTVADLTAVLSDGTVLLAPETYSYGQTILEVVPNAATTKWGTKRHLQMNPLAEVVAIA